MKSLTKKALVLAVFAGSTQVSYGADSITEALKESKVGGAMNLRYEDVEVGDNSSDGITLRSRFTITTGSYENFSAVVGFEDVRDVLGVDDEGGFILDPEVTEVDQGFLQYKTEAGTAKLGRQVIALDNQRYVGHVGWRQDRQTFDALSFTGKSGDFSYTAAFVYKYNRIVGEAADFDAETILLNGSYNTSIGKLTGYAYLLDRKENDAEANNSDTIGVRLTGSTSGDMPFIYTAEVAMQSTDAPDTPANAESHDALYYLFEGGTKVSGTTLKLGYELRGSDDGGYGFSTPLATGHAFNGWADIFLVPGNSGMSDLFFSAAGKVGPVSLLGVYHTYEPDEGDADLGDEINLQATMPLGGGVTAGLKYAGYSAGDGGTDVDKIWAWFGYSF